MAFDRDNPTDLATLKNEVSGDPAAMDYAGKAAGGQNTDDLLRMLNTASENVGGENINRPTEELDIPDLAEVIDSSEYAALSEYDKEWVKMFIDRPAAELLKPYQAKFLAIFGAGSATRTAALALRSKPATRAEVLFGVNTVISRQDWFAARDS